MRLNLAAENLISKSKHLFFDIKTQAIDIKTDIYYTIL